MRAVVVQEFGGPEVLRLHEVADPVPGRGEVLVRLRAAGVNPVETYIRSGRYARLPALPFIPGFDGAGEVVALGPGTRRHRVGDRVYVAGAPTYAELVAAPEEVVWPLPDNLTFEQGAAVGIPYVTAYLALHPVARALPGERVLVRGGSGGVGVATIQMAAALGCRVVATAGTDRGRALVIEEGAEAAAGHDDEGRLAELAAGEGYDVIVDVAADRHLASDLHLLAPGGRLAIVGSRGRAEIDPGVVLRKRAVVAGVYSLQAGEHLPRAHWAIGAGLRQRTLRPVVGRILPLEQAPAAHEAIGSPGAYGKIVLAIA